MGAIDRCGFDGELYQIVAQVGGRLQRSPFAQLLPQIIATNSG
jgi:hypothetical protein